VFAADAMPTVLRLLGVAAPDGLAGVARVEPQPSASQPAALISLASSMPCLFSCAPLFALAIGAARRARSRAGGPAL
jgi:hypothetical protein